MQTDTEINEAVARKLGVQYIGIDDPRFNNALWNSLRCPNYCGSIAAAWEIVEWALHNQKAFNLNVTPTMKPMWEAGFFSRGDVQADTAPMAICLAFLKLNER